MEFKGTKMAVKAHYIFDVDGTLTPSRDKIDPQFAEWFKQFVTVNTVCLVTGSDRIKTIEQIGEMLFNMCDMAYNCSGNDVYRFGMPHRKNEWKLSQEHLDWLDVKLKQSKWKIYTGQHIDQRTGTANFSVVGRGASWSQRKEYYLWDQQNKQRESIAKEMVEKFPELDAKVGGETGIDIFEKGKDKSQIIDDFPYEDKLRFFGDRIDPSGNDYTLAQAIARRSPAHRNNKIFKVRDWQHTWDELKYFDHRLPMYKGDGKPEPLTAKQRNKLI